MSLLHATFLLAFAQAAFCADLAPAEPSLAQAVAKLSMDAGPPNGYRIEAYERNITFHQQGIVEELLNNPTKRSQLDPQKIAALEARRASLPETSVDICSNVYRFGSGGVISTRLHYSARGLMVRKETTLAKAEEVFESDVLLQGMDLTEAVPGTGTISRRSREPVAGWPLFLSRAVLKGWIEASSGVRYELGESPRGEPCGIVTVPAPPGTPIAGRKLFLRLGDFTPVALSSYLPDGKLSSFTELEFRETGSDSMFCRRAKTSFYLSGNVFQETSWEMLVAAKDDASILTNSDAFFVPGTRVADQRFSKLISYRAGQRLPNEAEVQQMMVKSNGAVRYELAASAFPKRPERPETAKSSGFPRFAVIAALMLNSALLVFVLLRRRKGIPTDGGGRRL